MNEWGVEYLIDAFYNIRMHVNHYKQHRLTAEECIDAIEQEQETFQKDFNELHKKKPVGHDGLNKKTI